MADPEAVPAVVELLLEALGVRARVPGFLLGLRQRVPDRLERLGRVLEILRLVVAVLLERFQRCERRFAGPALPSLAQLDAHALQQGFGVGDGFLGGPAGPGAVVQFGGAALLHLVGERVDLVEHRRHRSILSKLLSSAFRKASRAPESVL
ncbi:hypothetical protein [Amycolatopsis sp. DG1A-15b]|uniref:hypothetical protein n=1 Tax=Amycolatopsis sp. DG1A-15b TaxID=3052846 RepID=UPI00255BB530|nr:hypothetical protein [Amycolatopsis sp. DG1A-15b]WIX92337.1 hypothetical protein QRY02_18570 [Amycolatopsis sp. DG1A-15b]